MKKIAFILLVGLSVAGCATYDNKERYELTVNENAEIYYSTNSCCFYCLANEDQLKHVKLVEQKTIDPGPSDCEGCNHTGAFVFVGTSVGVDTIQLKHLTATMNCDSSAIRVENYIIEVK